MERKRENQNQNVQTIHSHDELERCLLAELHEGHGDGDAHEDGERAVIRQRASPAHGAVVDLRMAS